MTAHQKKSCVPVVNMKSHHLLNPSSAFIRPHASGMHACIFRVLKKQQPRATIRTGLLFFFSDFFSYKPGLLLGRGHYQDGACIIFFTKKIRPKKKILAKTFLQHSYPLSQSLTPGFYQDGVTIRTGLLFFCFRFFFL